MEEWRAVQGFEGYEVSSEGRVRSLDRYVKRGTATLTLKGKILKNILCNNGYYKVVLKGQKQRTVHSLVCLAFHPNIENKPTVDHINRDRKDNKANNLRWASWNEQRLNCTLNVVSNTGERNIRKRNDTNYTVEIQRLHQYTYDCFQTLEEAIAFRDSILNPTDNAE